LCAHRGALDKILIFCSSLRLSQNANLRGAGRWKEKEEQGRKGCGRNENLPTWMKSNTISAMKGYQMDETLFTMDSHHKNAIAEMKEYSCLNQVIWMK